MLPVTMLALVHSLTFFSPAMFGSFMFSFICYK